MNNDAIGWLREHRLLIAILIIIILVIGLAFAAILTLTISPDNPGNPGAAYPYKTSFQVSLPEGQTVKIGDLPLTALSYGRQITLKIGDRREEMKSGEVREIADRTAVIKMFGKPVFETGYRLSATWTGIINNQAQFKVSLQTSRQVPDWLVRRMLPTDIQASPV
jgi:hypothetical protein